MTELVVRLVFSLAVVLGLLLLTARVAGKRFKGGAGSPVRVLHRQSISRGAAVSVVAVGGRVLVLGTTEQQVRVLTELDPDELDLDEALAGRACRDHDVEDVDQEYAGVTRLPAGPRPLPRADLDEDDAFGRTLDQALAPLALQAQVDAAPPAPRTTAAAAPGADRTPGRHAARRAPAKPARVAATDAGPLAGSLLSPKTWRQAAQAVSGRAS